MKRRSNTTSLKSKSSRKKSLSIFFVNIKNKRLKLGLSQKELAEKLNIPHQRISELENGAFVESPEKLIAIAKALNCSLDWLFGISEEP